MFFFFWGRRFGDVGEIEVFVGGVERLFFEGFGSEEVVRRVIEWGGLENDRGRGEVAGSGVNVFVVGLVF